MATVSIRASDVAEYDSWNSGALGIDQLDLNSLAKDMAYGESYWARAGSGVQRARESGVDLAASQDIVSGVGGGLFAVAGWASPATLKAGALSLGGAIGIFGLKGLRAADRSGDVWAASTLAQDVAAARRSAARSGLQLSDDVLVDGANQIPRRLGYEADPAKIPFDWRAPSVSIPGEWRNSNRSMDLLPIEFVEQFAEFNRSGSRVDDFVRTLPVRGLDEPFLMDVSSNGLGLLIDGNHRLAAARRLGWTHVPVTVVTAGERSVGAPIALRGSFGPGKLGKLSDFADVPALSYAATQDALAGRVRLFHGISPAPFGENPTNVNDIVESVMKKGLLPDPGRKNTGAVYGTDQFRMAYGFGWGDDPDFNVRVVVEYVADPKVARLRNGYPTYQSIPKEQIAAIHLADEGVVLSKVLDENLSTVLDDIGASRRFSGGFSWDPRSGNFDFKSGYITGISPLHTLKIPADQFHSKDVLRFLDHKGHSTVRVSKLLAEDPKAVIGGWYYNGDVYLDVSKIFDDVDEAKAVGAKFGEIAIYDLKNGVDIKLAEGLKPSLTARAAFGGRTPPETANLKDLPYYFGGEKVAGGTLVPEMATVDFSSLTVGQKKYIADSLIARGPEEKFTAKNFNNKIVNDWLRGEREKLLALPESSQKLLRDAKGDLPLVDFFRELRMSKVPGAVGANAAMYRRITASILDGDFPAVHKALAAQANNLSKFVSSQEALRPNFYPYMAQMTLMNASKTPASMLAPMLAASSPLVGPGPEAGRALRAMEKMRKNPEKYYRINDGVAEFIAPGSGFELSVMKLAVDVANNPDWIMNPVRGLSIKTYVYGLLKLNPRLSRALVVDTVDTQMRFGTNMGISWDKSIPGELSEISLNQYVTRVMASYFDAPVFGVQESGWNTFRSVRDRASGTPSSLMYKGRPIGDVYQSIGMPPDLAVLAQRNYSKLVDDVRAGRAPHWQEFEPGSNVLIPSDDLPLEMLLEPTVRAKPGAPERFRAMVESAEAFGESLRKKRG